MRQDTHFKPLEVEGKSTREGIAASGSKVREARPEASAAQHLHDVLGVGEVPYRVHGSADLVSTAAPRASKGCCRCGVSE